MGYLAEHAKTLSDTELRDAIIENAAKVANNDGRLSASSSADLDLALEIFDAALAEHVRRATAPLDDIIRRARSVQPGHSAGPTREELFTMVQQIRGILQERQ